MIIKENGGERNERDHYPTPYEFCIQALVQLQPWILRKTSPFETGPLRVLDAGAGGGPWGEAVRKLHPSAHIVGVDLPGVEPVAAYDEWHSEYFELWAAEYTGEPFHFVVGNPPYADKRPEAWLKVIWHRLLYPTGRLFWLLRLAWFSSHGRFTRLWTQGYMPAAIYQSARRISFTGDNKTDDTDYAMFLWLRNFKNDYGHISAFDWKPEKPPQPELPLMSAVEREGGAP